MGKGIGYLKIIRFYKNWRFYIAHDLKANPVTCENVALRKAFEKAGVV